MKKNQRKCRVWSLKETGFTSFYFACKKSLDNSFYSRKTTLAFELLLGDIEYINYGQKNIKICLFFSEIFLIKTSQIQQFFLLQWKNNNVGLFSTWSFLWCVSDFFFFFFIQQHSCYKSFIVEEKKWNDHGELKNELL